MSGTSAPVVPDEVAPATDVPAAGDGDHSDARRREHVHPVAWQTPVPHPIYDLVVVGGGTAGLVAAMGAAGLGARVALVERDLLGGDCLNTGCVPSKALIRSARAAGESRSASALGVEAHVEVDFPAVMARMRARRASLAVHDAAARFEAAGVHVFFGDGRFAGPRTVDVAGLHLRFNRAVIATGSRPAIPPIAGLQGVPFFTNETIFDLLVRPSHLLIIGAGPIGCELAQAFARLGSEVTVFDRSPRVLPNDDPSAAAVLEDCLRREGVRLELGVDIDGVHPDGPRLRMRWHARTAEVEARSTEGDVLLVATGRQPNVESLQLEAAGVRTDAGGIVVNDRLQSTNRRIFASGDVCARYKFTHAADAMSRLVVRNALFFGRARASALTVPWVTYTDPEVAHVGVTRQDVDRSNGRLSTITVPLTTVDRAVIDDATDGFVAVHHQRGRLRGVTIVAPHAGEMIGEAAYALANGGTLAAFSDTIHPYPTFAEAFRKAGDQYRRQALTPRIRRLLTRYFDLTR